MSMPSEHIGSSEVESTALAVQMELIPSWRRWIVQWDVSHNAIPLAFFAFTAMWQTASANLGTVGAFAKTIYLILFYTSCIIFTITFSIFIARIIIYPASLASDFHHPRLMNFFFMPVIIGCLFVLTLPVCAARSVTGYEISFYILAAYQLTLALYMYGEWLFGAHPTNFIHPLVFMQTIGYFLTANIGARAHLVEQATAMLYIGVLFWLLVFITNFQHVALALDKQREKPAPTFFLFIAPPAQAALSFVVLETANVAAQGTLDTSQLLPVTSIDKFPQFGQAFLYIDLFLYCLMFRLFPTFWTSKFNVSCWAYIFPLSAASSAIIWKYVSTGDGFWEILAIICGIIACIAMVIVFVFTIRSIAIGKTPSNPSSLHAYTEYYTKAAASRRDERDEDSRNSTVDQQEDIEASHASGFGFS